MNDSLLTRDFKQLILNCPFKIESSDEEEEVSMEETVKERKRRRRANLSLDSSSAHDIYHPNYSSDEEPIIFNITKTAEFGSPVDDKDEEYRQLEEYFIQSSDSDDINEEIEFEQKYIT